MKISLLGPTNMKKFSSLTSLPLEKIETYAEEIGRVIAQNKFELIVIFNYSGMLKLIGDSYKKHGGKLEILYTDNDYDWYTDIYMKHLKEADITTKKQSWHDMLLSLVKDSDIVLCSGLSAGVFAELGYMKWNYQENKGKAKTLIGIKEFLRNKEFPPEITLSMKENITICKVKELEKELKKITKK